MALIEKPIVSLHKNGMSYLKINGKKIATMDLQDIKEVSCYIYRLEVVKEYRNMGYGSMLMGEIIEILKERNKTAVSLYVETINKGAIRFYERFGFFISMIREAEKGKHRKHYLMTLKLNE